MVKTLKKMPYAQARVWESEGIGRKCRMLISYSTHVIEVDNGGMMRCTGLYSMTTRKHISAFLWEYYPNISFNMVKAIAGTDKTLDTETGEIIG